MEYYQDLITKKSFTVLQDFKKQYQFILIGGWAVFLFAHSLKSKDIDIVVDFSELDKLRQRFNLIKNDRLQKYEVSLEGIDVDIYVPFYSNPGIPAEEIKKYTQTLEGFNIAKPEILLILKQKAYHERSGSPKGEKDKIDIVSLLKNIVLDFSFYKTILKKYQIENYLEELRNLLNIIAEVTELELNQFQYARLKKKLLAQL